MRNFISVLLAVLLATSPVLANKQTINGEGFVQVRATAYEQGCSVNWNGENAAYIFGSMHVSFLEWFPLHLIAEEAVTCADVFAFEITLNELFNLSSEMVEEIVALQTIPDGIKLEALLPEDIFENFITNLETFEVIGITYALVKHLTPAALLTSLSGIMCSILGLDMWLVETYVTQDIEALCELFNETYASGAYSQYTQLFNYNLFHLSCRIFADEIARLLQETEKPTTFFVTVGLRHIIGGDGDKVLYLLEGMGFEMTPLWNR